MQDGLSWRLKCNGALLRWFLFQAIGLVGLEFVGGLAVLSYSHGRCYRDCQSVASARNLSEKARAPVSERVLSPRAGNTPETGVLSEYSDRF
jgi:hypothetical protein